MRGSDLFVRSRGTTLSNIMRGVDIHGTKQIIRNDLSVTIIK
jgi:hypothetical protein